MSECCELPQVRCLCMPYVWVEVVCRYEHKVTWLHVLLAHLNRECVKLWTHERLC